MRQTETKMSQAETKIGQPDRPGSVSPKPRSAIQTRYDCCSGKNREISRGSIHVGSNSFVLNCKKDTICLRERGLTIVEQAPTLPTIKEFPLRDLPESFEAVFVEIDPQDLRKKQTFPISKTLLVKPTCLLSSID